MDRSLSAIILIMIAIVASVLTVAWVGIIRPSTGIQIDAQIYSKESNLGILNEDATFSISIENFLNKSRRFKVVVNSEQNEIYNETFEIMRNSTRNLTINQKLIFSGLWTIRVFEKNKTIDGYSFVTVVNKAEADLRITQMDNIKINRILSIIAIIVSLLIPIYSVSKYLYSKYQSKKNKNIRINEKTRDHKN